MTRFFELSSPNRYIVTIMILDVVIEPLTDTDDLVEITRVIHEAYAPLGKAGLKFFGTHQTVEETKNRFSGGMGLVAHINNVVVGTIMISPPDPTSEVEVYRDVHTWHFSQFAVDPRYQGLGVGKALHLSALDLVAKCGAKTLTLDTAESATALISLYQSWGYTFVGYCDWRPLTNYRSVVMARPVK